MSDLYSKGPVRIRSSVIGDVLHLKDRLREADRIEIMASHRHEPYEALYYGLNHSTFCATVLYAGEPVAMFGVVPDAKNKKAGAAWLLASDGLYQMRWSFLRLSRRYVKLMQARYPILYNFIDSRNLSTIRWLCWLGASLSDPQPIGIGGVTFQAFRLEKECALV